MSEQPQAASSLALARQQMYAARTQAVALLASIDASLATMPKDEAAPQPKRLAYMGADEENQT